MAQQRLQLLATIYLGDPSANDLAIRVQLPSGVFGASYVGAFIASGGTEPYTYAVSSGSLPTGLSLDTSTGAVTGTCTATGRFEFTAAVTDSALSPATASRVVAVIVNSGITFAQVFARGEVGIAYSSGISASGGTAPYSWAVTSGSLPTGLSINSSTGVVSGTPSADGTFNFTLTATDAATNTQDFPTSITIAAAVSLTGSMPDGVVGIAYSSAPALAGGVGPYSFAITSGAIPTGCSFSATSGTVYGTCTAAGTYTFDITVTDFLGGTDTSSQSVDFSVAGGGSSGTVTDFSSGNLSPLFNTNVATSTTTPALTFTQIAQAINVVFAGPASGSSANPTFRALVAADIPALDYQAKIQVQDEGVNKGSPGDATTRNYVGPGVSVAVASNVETVTIPGGGASAGVFYFGDGSDLALVLDGTNTYPTLFTKAGSVYTQIADVWCDTLAITSGAQLVVNGGSAGYRIFCYTGIGDCSTGANPPIFVTGGAGQNASGGTRGLAGVSGGVNGTLGFGGAGGNGGGGGTGVGTGGSGGSAGGATAAQNGGRGAPPGAVSGSGGTGSGGAGGAMPSTAGMSPTKWRSADPYMFTVRTSSGGAPTFSSMGGGGGASGGGAGGGAGSGQSGAGGGGGGGGNVFYIAARDIFCGNYRLVGCDGGAGGNGGNAVTTNAGGGGGGSGGGGGYGHIVYQTLSGSGNLTLTAAGGIGGNAGTGLGTGTSGKGGTGGDGGTIIGYNLTTGVATTTTPTTGSANSGTAGGAGGTSTLTLTP